MWVNSGSVTLDASGRYTIDVSYQRLIGDIWTPITDSCSGTYSQASKNLEFQETGPCTGAYAGTLQNGLLTVWLGPALKVEYRLQEGAGPVPALGEILPAGIGEIG